MASCLFLIALWTEILDTDALIYTVCSNFLSTYNSQQKYDTIDKACDHTIGDM